MRVRSIVGAVCFSMVLGSASLTGTGGANAAERDSADLTEAIDKAVRKTGSSYARVNRDVSIPTEGSRRVIAPGSGGSISIDLPAEGGSELADDRLTRTYEGTAKDTEVAVQPTADGVRAVISIESSSAPERYRFQLGRDVKRLVRDKVSGGVWVIGKSGALLGTFERPWAFDANGAVVPTRYEIRGTVLTQVVEHKSGDYAYGITADPKWSKKWVKKFKKLFKACLGLTLSTEALIQLVSSPKKAAKFMVRRLGWFGAIFCGGGIIKELL